MGGVLSNSLKSSIKESVTDEEVMRPLRLQGVTLVKEISGDKDSRKHGITWVKEIAGDKDIRKQGVSFVRETVQDEDVKVAGSMVLKGIETNIYYVAVTLGFGVILYAINTFHKLFGKAPPPPPAAASAASAAASASMALSGASASAESASAARDSAAAAAFYNLATLSRPQQPEQRSEI
ncbi:hypothetical protein MKW94_002811 [Papaver nudicaule]|uniref:Uncharacterized protein n=1 Tax=Papaver nudicaule TaxID=74823 RepID=A0AA41SKC4_PAPNU|nr:hypothetical protein [Papaver nudicaule]